MKFFHSIRWRLQLWYGILLVTVLGGFGVTAYQLETIRQIRRIDEELQRRLPVLVESQRPVRGNRELREFSLAPRDASLFEGPGDEAFYYVVWLRHSLTPMTRSTGSPRDVPMPKPGDPPTRQRGDFREVFLFPGPGDCVLAGRSIAVELAGFRQLAWRLAGVGSCVLLCGLAIGGWLVQRALCPIRDIGAAAARIATGDLSQRISTPDFESELGQLAGVLNSTFARLDAAFAQQARFTSDAAHELRTPISVILMHADNGLAGECGNPEHREAFEATRRAARRMRRLTESLLELARLDSGEGLIRRERCDLARIVCDGLDLIRPLADQRGIRIRAELGTAPCTGDADRLAQVVANLLVNAVDYNCDQGEIQVSTGHSQGGARLVVTNTGPAIPVGELPRVFERFHRGDKARSGSGGHAGLGLAIAKAVVQAHGGDISVRSDSEHGTTFTVTLPGAD